ncbi:EndoU domain-containing protein [Amycolatopsis sp. NPDC059027]|uniref:EndoU domain-containing protein n=1 Tax=unclassified Amycolatopsis TaxID=2618356 RepID=UPI0036730164
MGGGHAPGVGRRGTSEFPYGWSDRQIIAVIEDVANLPGEPRRRQHNGRWRCAGERYGVHVVVLADEDGQVRTAYPVGGPGVVRNPDTPKDPANPTLEDLTDSRITYYADRVLDQLADRIPAADFTHYRALLWAGEWEELVDVLAAHAVSVDLNLSTDEFADLERLLYSYEIPLPGFAFLNDRNKILERLRPNSPGTVTASAAR